MSDHVSFDPSIPAFNWNSDSLDKQLDASTVAQRDARKGEPRPDDETFQFYRRVKSELERVSKNGQSELDSHVRFKERDIGSIQGAISDLRNKLGDATSALHGICHAGVDDVVPLADKVQMTEDEYINFVETNNLDHRVANPKKTWGLWVILVLALFELLINGWSLGSAHVDGFLGALYEIVLFTIFNVIVGIAIGALWRRTNKRPWTSGSALAARVLIPFLVIAVIFFGYLFAHYRDALITLQSIASTDIASFLDTWGNLFTRTWETAFSEDWVPNTMPSVVLMLACCLISTFVAVDWYFCDDPYPGFGKVSRKRDEAGKAYTKKVRDVKQLLTAEANDAKNFCRGKLLAVQSAQQIPNQVQSWGVEFKTFIEQLTAFGRDQLGEYRKINRQNHPWPSQLDQQIDEFKFDENLVRVPRLGDASQDAIPDASEVNDFVEHATHVIESARSGYEKVFAPLTALYPKDANFAKFNQPYDAVERVEQKVKEMKISYE